MKYFHGAEYDDPEDVMALCKEHKAYDPDQRYGIWHEISYEELQVLDVMEH